MFCFILNYLSFIVILRKTLTMSSHIEAYEYFITTSCRLHNNMFNIICIEIPQISQLRPKILFKSYALITRIQFTTIYPERINKMVSGSGIGPVTSQSTQIERSQKFQNLCHCINLSDKGKQHFILYKSVLFWDDIKINIISMNNKYNQIFFLCRKLIYINSHQKTLVNYCLKLVRSHRVGTNKAFHTFW